MEGTVLCSDSSESEDLSLDNYSVHRLASSNTDTEDTSDGSDEENRVTGLETNKTSNSRNDLLGTTQKHSEINQATKEGHEDEAQVHTSRNEKSSPKTSTTNTKQIPEVSPGGECGASSTAQAYSPEEENELFSSEYVDKLVASFWSKVDQKIETAVSQYQSSPQAGQQTTTQHNAHTDTTKTEDEQNDEKSSPSRSNGGVCFYIFFILQECFTDGVWREDLRAIITHRHSNFIVVMVTMIDCFLVVANVLADFDVIDDRGIEFFFTGFLFLNLTIMFLFLFECFLRIIVLRRDLFQDKMEVFDLILMGFYFLVEAISSHGFRDVSKPYPKYLHMIVILRCWRIVVILEQLQQEKEAELCAMESQTPR